MAEPGPLGTQRSSFRPQAGTWQILPVTLASRAPRPVLPDPASWALLRGTPWSPHGLSLFQDHLIQSFWSKSGSKSNESKVTSCKSHGLFSVILGDNQSPKTLS